MMLRSSSSTPNMAALVSNFWWCLVVLTTLTSLPQLAHAANKDQWRSRSIYQILTDRFARTDGSLTAPCDLKKQLFCGGTFQGIIDKLDYIQGMGFTAIWISPVVENIPEITEYGQGYHGFWTHDVYKINSHFGDVDTLKRLSDELHKRGMYFMIDVVVNNIAAKGPGATVDYAKFQPPFNDKKYFHPFGFIKDFSDQLQVQNRWLGDDIVALPDLDTESDYVQNFWHGWVQEMIANYSLDGLRIDAAKHVNKPFWTPFQEAADVFTMGEVFTQAEEEANATCSWAIDALDTVLNFKTWHSIRGTFSDSKNPMGGLGYVMNKVAVGCRDSTLLGTFSENHDVQRFASETSDLSQQMNALTFTIMSDGIPVVYYGAEQRFSGKGDPQNREAMWLGPNGYDTKAPLYQLIRSLNIARNAVNKELDGIDYSNWSGYWAHKAKILYANQDILVLRKGYDTTIITALTNVGEGGPDVGPYHMGETNLVEGQTIVEVLSCNSTRVGKYGEFDLTLKNGEPQVWVPARYLHTVQGLCPDLLARLNRTGATTERSAAGPSSSFLQPHTLALYIGSIAFSALFVLLAGS